MSLLHKFMGTGSPSAPTYVDDVFSAYTYTGNGSTQTITNGIDLAGKGGLVWTKTRSSVQDNRLTDTAVGGTKFRVSNTTAADATFGTATTFNSSGFTTAESASSTTYASWTFRKAAKFFDVVTYTGTGVDRTLSHSLGQAPGMVVVKNTSSASDWFVYHRSTGAANVLYLDLTNASSASGAWVSTTPDASTFTVSSSLNGSGSTYVAYLFAHDTAADGLIQCGTFTTDGSGNATVTLGWEPQFVLTKRSDNSTAGNWYINDSSRGMTVESANSQMLFANLTNAEAAGGVVGPISTGFKYSNSPTSSQFIYMAIRRPNKPPTTGTQVYNAIARTGTGAAATVTGVGFAPDLDITATRGSAVGSWFYDRLRGTSAYLTSTSTGAEGTATGEVNSFDMDGITVGTNPTLQTTNVNTRTYINWFFKRAPQVFDEVCYTGTGSATTVAHNLGVAPELMIVKSRSGVVNWVVYHSANANSGGMQLNTTAAFTAATDYWNSTSPTSTVFSVGTRVDTNQSTATFVAYLFATKAGISKVGSYTGNGTSQTINCGFSAGARFILIKKTSSTGDWFVWDTVRGIGSGFDPHLSLNTTAAEVSGTTDSIDPDNTGFIVNSQAGYDINATSATYIYLAFA